MNKREIAKKYGQERMKVMHFFLDKINRLYGFVYSKENLYDFAVSLENFTKEDLGKALLYLEDRESAFSLKFNEIKLACKEARIFRKRNENINKPIESPNSIPMPENVKTLLGRIFKKETKRGVNGQ